MSTEFPQVALDGQTVTLTVRDARISSIAPASGPAKAVVMPLPVDPHVHLDKTFSIQRCGAIKPGLFGAIEACQADAKTWTAADIRKRAERGLAEAYANGICAMRTHVDWMQPAPPLAWSVIGELAEAWAGKLTLRRAALVPLDLLGDAEAGPVIARHVAEGGGVLGCFVYRNDDLEAKLRRVFALAERHDLRLDFHVDEGLEPDAQGFDAIVAMTQSFRMAGRVLCGHACSLSVRPPEAAARAMAAAAEAGVALTVLPTTNLHLQDMAPGRSPRLRGLAPLQELREAGVTVLLGADNVADPFYPRGCYDALDTLRLACLAGHVRPADWLGAISTEAADTLGLPHPGLTVGAPADFLLMDGTDWDDALRDPRAGRRIVRAGQTQSLGKDAA